MVRVFCSFHRDFRRFDSLHFYAFKRMGTGGNPWFLGEFLSHTGDSGDGCRCILSFAGMVFGTGVDCQTIVSKVLVDQFIYCVIWASPITALFYGWKDSGYSETLALVCKQLIETIILFNLTTWMVWTPATAIVYSPPTALQIPLFNLTLCFFVLLVSVYGKK